MDEAPEVVNDLDQGGFGWAVANAVRRRFNDVFQAWRVAVDHRWGDTGSLHVSVNISCGENGETIVSRGIEMKGWQPGSDLARWSNMASEKLLGAVCERLARFCVGPHPSHGV